MTYIFWLLEFILECSGAFLCFRRRLFIVSASLAWAALSDIVCFALRNIHPAYGYTAWAFEAIQYLILCALAVQIVSRMLEDYRKLTGLACGLCALLGVIVGFVWNRGETWEGKFLEAEISASFFLAAMIVLGWIGQKRPMEGTWKLITYGLLSVTAGNAACAAANTLHLYPISAIASLLLWNLAALRNQRKLREYDAVAFHSEQQHLLQSGRGVMCGCGIVVPPEYIEYHTYCYPRPVASVKPERGVWVEPSKWRVN